jgi:hypothetical protein
VQAFSVFSDLEITLQSGTAPEVATRVALRGLLAKFDLTGWIFTRHVHINETATPHSHPILTLNARNRDNTTLLLSEFVHEQLHWFEEDNQQARDKAIEETVLRYPNVPLSRPEGAVDELSTRLHLLVCYLEFQAMQLLVGRRTARETMLDLSRHHYCWIYRTILEDERAIRKIILKYDLLPHSLRGGTRKPK